MNVTVVNFLISCIVISLPFILDKYWNLEKIQYGVICTLLGFASTLIHIMILRGI